MDWDDVRPNRVTAITIGEPLHTLSLKDLEDRIAALEQEIQRVRSEVSAKRQHEQAASALFRSKGSP